MCIVPAAQSNAGVLLVVVVPASAGAVGCPPSWPPPYERVAGADP